MKKLATKFDGRWLIVMSGGLFLGLLLFVFVSSLLDKINSSLFFEKIETLALAMPLVLIPALRVLSSSDIGGWANKEGRYKSLRLFGYGIISMFQVYLGLLILFWACVVASILLPYKLVSIYILSAKATLKTALGAIAVIWACSGFSFAILYFFALWKRLGNIRNGNELFFDSRVKGDPWISMAAIQILYYSFCNIFGVDSGLRGTGSCKWIALFQACYVRLLEISIIAAGISQIMARHI